MTKDYPMLIAAACEDGDLKGLAALAVELYGKVSQDEERRARGAEKKRRQRENVPGQQGTVGDSGGQSGTPPSPPQVSPSFPTPHITPSFPPPPPTTTTTTARARLLAIMPDSTSWEAEMDASLNGMHGKPITAEQLEVACRDFLGNGASKSPSLRHFRAYLRDASRPAPELPTRKAPQGGARNDAALESWLRKKEAADGE